MAKSKELVADKNKETPIAITEQDIVTRLALAKQFIESVIFNQYRQLVSWKSVTGQSSQIDSGYLGQQLVSILTGIPGCGTRGKGKDLEDGSEVKTASTLSGVDIPRWNNSLKTQKKVKEFLDFPAIFFVLFDTPKKDQSFPLRVRIWKVCPKTDSVFSNVVDKWAEKKTSGNFQLHPPCWRDTNIVTNDEGSIEMPLVFYALQKEIGDIDYMDIVEYNEKTLSCKLEILNTTDLKQGK